MTSIWTAFAIALFIWWFSTGAILFAVKLADRVAASGRARPHLTVTLGALPVLAVGGWAIWLSLSMETVGGAYLAFLGALAVWGWFELAFLTGVLTGPVVQHCPPDVGPTERFIRAWGTIAYSEMALMATLILLVLVSWNAPNTFAMWTFIILFFARVSAKLNVYLGVPNINTEFLPHPVRHLSSHFRVAPMNWFFPISITALTLAVGCWLERIAASAGNPGDQVGFALLATLSALAMLEHWFMILPLADAKLWRWLIALANKEVAAETAKDPKRSAHNDTATSNYMYEDARGLR